MAFQPEGFQNSAFQLITFEDSISLAGVSATLLHTATATYAVSLTMQATADMPTGQVIPPTLLADLFISSGTLSTILKLYGDQQALNLIFSYPTQIKAGFQTNAFQANAFQAEDISGTNQPLVVT